MLLKAVLLFVALSVASAQNRVAIRPCPNGQPMPQWFESNHCSTTRCTLTRGQVFTGTAHVIPGAPFSTLTVSLSATIFGIPFPLTIPPGYGNACDFLLQGGSCPVSSGGLYWWGLQFPVAATYPAANNLVITLSAGEAGRQVACAIVDADLV